MPDDRRDQNRDSDEGGGRDYLGRIVIGFAVLAALFWILTWLF